MNGTRAIAVGLLLALAAPARAERAATAILWLDRGDEASAASLERALQSAKELRPLDDARVKRLLFEGGPASRVDERVAAGRERFASLSALAEADALLAEAEAIAVRELAVAVGCAKLVEIETLRLRYAELGHDEPAAAHAVWILSACAPSPSPDMKAAIARHPTPCPMHARVDRGPPVRIESEPPGATVYLDLRPVGKTPLDLRAAAGTCGWGANAFVDLELDGFAKVHHAVPRDALSVPLARADRLPSLVDGVRAASGEPEADRVVAIGREVGASRVLTVRRDPAGGLQARVVDVAAGRWIKAATAVTVKPGEDPSARLVEYAAAPNLIAPSGVVGSGPIDASAGSKGAVAHHGPQITAAPKAASAPVPAWKKWYTWVAAGAVLALVGGLVVAERVGDDKVTVHVTH